MDQDTRQVNPGGGAHRAPKVPVGNQWELENVPEEDVSQAPHSLAENTGKSTKRSKVTSEKGCQASMFGMLFPAFPEWPQTWTIPCLPSEATSR